MLTVTILVGCPASGKSTWALKLVEKHAGKYKRINRDSLRKMLDASHFSKDNEKFITQVESYLILQALEEGKHVIVDNTHLNPVHINRIKELVKGKAEVIINDSFLQVPIEECIKRDLKRLDSVGKDVIMKMYNQFLKPEPIKIEHNASLPTAILYDLDGTLCLMNGRSPYDASTCEQDLPNKPVVELYNKFKDDYTIILLSGRQDTWRQQTENWLAKNGITYHSLHMRKEGDFRKDTVIKEELYNEFIKDKYNVNFIVDDRKSVCNHWRSLGLTVFQVAEGDF